MNGSYSKSHYCQFGCFKFQNIYVGFLLHLSFALAMIPPCLPPPPPPPKPLLSSLNVTSDFCRSVELLSEVLCIGFISFPFYPVEDLESYSTDLLIPLRDSFKTPSSEAEILTYLKQLVLALKLSSRYWNFH